MKNLFLMLIFVSVCSFMTAQNTANDLFNTDEIVWFGLDFSKAKFIGHFDQAAGAAPATSGDIKHNYVAAWNNLIPSEPKRYDIGKTFRKSIVSFDLGPVTVSNRTMDEGTMMSYNDYSFENAAAVVENIVSGYSNISKKEGIGVVFIIEYFNRTNQQTSAYVTFFDIASKDILFTERMTGKPRGIGLRNYWAGSIHNILTQIDKNAYRSWQRAYGK